MNKSFQWWPDQASSFAPGVDALYLFLIAVTVFFTVLIFVLIAFLSLKYRRARDEAAGGSDEPHAGIDLDGHPVAADMVMFVWGAGLYVHMRRPPDDAMQINVIGKQWMWKIQHPNGKREINELHIPLGRPIKLMMTSQDVIHTFYIPAFRVKQDVVPGRYTTEWFTPTKIGEYHLFCAEYCGNAAFGDDRQGDRDGAGGIPGMARRHAGGSIARRRGRKAVHAVSAASPATASAGRRLAGLYGSKRQADRTAATVIADENYLRESILNPGAKIVAGFQPLMPTFAGQLDRRAGDGAGRVHQVVATRQARTQECRRFKRTNDKYHDVCSLHPRRRHA